MTHSDTIHIHTHYTFTLHTHHTQIYTHTYTLYTLTHILHTHKHIHTTHKHTHHKHIYSKKYTYHKHIYILHTYIYATHKQTHIPPHIHIMHTHRVTETHQESCNRSHLPLRLCTWEVGQPGAGKGGWARQRLGWALEQGGEMPGMQPSIYHIFIKYRLAQMPVTTPGETARAGPARPGSGLSQVTGRWDPTDQVGCTGTLCLPLHW